MNKKGFFLAEETLKIVIALICIGFLIYFLTSLYFANRDDKALEMAKSSLPKLIEDLNAEVTEPIVQNPQGWAILSWPHLENKIIPKSCSNLGWDNCICICKFPNGFKVLWKSITGSGISAYADKCDEMGVCLENPKQIIVKGSGDKQSPIKIGSPPRLKADYEKKELTEK